MVTDDRSTTELRLALVCYGGVSLAIYMHGVTLELHKLIVASRAFDEVGVAGVNPFDQHSDSEHAYFEALRDLAQGGKQLSVTVDIVAGTSAGGINGVCLAKVLSQNGSQQALKKLWIEQGDLKTLLRAPQVGGWHTRAAMSLVATLVKLFKVTSPLKGEVMSQLLYDAIADMDAPATPDRSSLLLPNTPLELFVTTTDLAGFPVIVPSGVGGIIQRETSHAQVMEFRSDGAHNGFGPESVSALTFAARTTSSFPGAFAPVSLASFATELAGRPLTGQQVQFRRKYSELDHSLANAWFVDGGVLDNAPFDLVVEAIGKKRAETEVLRRLIYIQPDPGTRLGTSNPEDHSVATAPTYLAGLMQGAVSVKGSHSIVRDLEGIRDLNRRIDEIGDIAQLQMRQINAEIAAATGTGGAAGDQTSTTEWDASDMGDVRQVAVRVQASVPQLVGASYPTYCRLKAETAGRRLADEVTRLFSYPPGSSRESFIRAAISAWARQHVEWTDPNPAALMDLLGPVDVPYRERRLMFILAGVNAMYARVDDQASLFQRSTLDLLKDKAWELLTAVRDAPRLAVGAVTSSTTFLGADLSDEAVFSNPEAFGQAKDEEFTRLFRDYSAQLATQLDDSSVPLWEGYVELTRGWQVQDRRELLSRYLGFPLWDALIFPTVAMSELPQFSPIAVSQFSPLAAMALPTPKGGKLKGVSLHHFGGFVDASWRENDYLWGRLDTVELLLRTLRSTTSDPHRTTPSDATDAAEQAGPQLRPALDAILTAESDLRRNPNLIPSLRTAVEQLGL